MCVVPDPCNNLGMSMFLEVLKVPQDPPSSPVNNSNQNLPMLSLRTTRRQRPERVKAPSLLFIN